MGGANAVTGEEATAPASRMVREWQRGRCERSEGVAAVAGGGGGRDELEDNGGVEEERREVGVWVLR